MTPLKLTIGSHEKLSPDVFRMTLSGDLPEMPRPGQFLNLLLPGFFLRRPFSIQEAGKDFVKVLYKVVGSGTQAMSVLKEDDVLDVLLPLGNVLRFENAGENPLLAGGGLGVAPLYPAAKKLTEEGIRPLVILGAKTAGDVFLEEEYEALGCDVRVVTEDGSRGSKGFVTDALPDTVSYLYTCGPLAMMRALFRTVRCGGQFLLEEHMGCGFGACMGCSVHTKSGAKRVCKDGPVFDKEDLLWED